MPRTNLIAIGLAAVALNGPGPVFADANDGEFMGYTLNQQYPLTDKTQAGPSLSGNLLLIAEHPVMPPDFEVVKLTTTISSHTIGFIEAAQNFATEEQARAFAKKYYDLLHAKYPAWRIEMDNVQLSETTLRPTALNMDKWPYTIRMKLAETESADGRPFRMSLTLRYLFDSPQRRAWNQLARDEHDEQAQSSQEQLLKESDTRGL